MRFVEENDLSHEFYVFLSFLKCSKFLWICYDGQFNLKFLKISLLPVYYIASDLYNITSNSKSCE
ncbi:hypothetical protein C0J52_11719 [Blattella germanica]|nr:hypothetical protein C0J52_11719 [Blattella germanica]